MQVNTKMFIPNIFNIVKLLRDFTLLNKIMKTRRNLILTSEMRFSERNGKGELKVEGQIKSYPFLVYNGKFAKEIYKGIIYSNIPKTTLKKRIKIFLLLIRSQIQTN